MELTEASRRSTGTLLPPTGSWLTRSQSNSGCWGSRWASKTVSSSVAWVWLGAGDQGRPWAWDSHDFSNPSQATFRPPFTPDMVAQALELSRKPHVVIATPGRLADHLRSSNTFHIKKIRFLVSQRP